MRRRTPLHLTGYAGLRSHIRIFRLRLTLLLFGGVSAEGSRAGQGKCPGHLDAIRASPISRGDSPAGRLVSPAGLAKRGLSAGGTFGHPDPSAGSFSPAL